MNERGALLAAVCADPDDDTLRLVFADWLQENGEGDRAEFIREQVRFAAEPRSSARLHGQGRERDRLVIKSAGR